MTSRPVRQSKYISMLHLSAPQRVEDISCSNTKRRTYISNAKHYFFNHIMLFWNALQQINFHLPFASIKHLLIRSLWSHFNQNFDPSNISTYHCVFPCSQCHLNPLKLLCPHHAAVMSKPLHALLVFIKFKNSQYAP